MERFNDPRFHHVRGDMGHWNPLICGYLWNVLTSFKTSVWVSFKGCEFQAFNLGFADTGALLDLPATRHATRRKCPATCG